MASSKSWLFLKTINRVGGLVFHSILTLLALFILLWFAWNFWPNKIETDSTNIPLALAHLRGLKHALHDRNAAEYMQNIFPEGACFTVSLYGWGYANIAPLLKGPDRKEALEEIRYALAQQTSPASLSPFADTEVRNGAFWMGQRNYLLGKYLRLMPPSNRPAAWVEEFHRNSSQLSEAFLASPTHHIDSYSGMCWPADNVTALASLAIHDELYGTAFRSAYDAWKEWTVAHPDPLTNMPAGHLYSKTGQHIEAARGCANSLIIPMLGEIDPAYARQLYRDYIRSFGITRFGARMFREWSRSDKEHAADVDSGPIIWGAGVTATGIGLATARSQGDIAVEADIRDLSTFLGIPLTSKIASHPAVRYLFGILPVGDAFLAWGYSIPRLQPPISPIPSRLHRIASRWMLPLILLFLFAATVAQAIYFGRKEWKKHRLAQ